MVSNVTFSHQPFEQGCSLVFRENITSGHYIYYEEVTRDMPGFETWPHHKVMNIEAPVCNSIDEEWIWRLPLSVSCQLVLSASALLPLVP